MAFEVSEIGIRMRVLGDDSSPEASAAGAGEPEEDDGKGIDGALVDECVRRVLQALKAMRER
jgi:hypothetical protein